MKEIAWTAHNGVGLQRTTVSLVKKDLPNRKSYQYSYDNRGNLEAIWYPDGTRAAMMYDFNGNLVQTIDRRNLSTTLAYNLSDMLVSKTTVDAVRGNTVVATTYTQFGPARVLKSEGAAAVVQNDFWYHRSGGILKQQQTIDGHTVEIDKTFDAAGNVTATTAIGSGASPATWTFTILPQFHPSTPDTDHFNRIAVADSGTTLNVVTHEPDFLSLAKTIKYGPYSSPVGSVADGYDKFLRLASIASGEATPYLDIALQRDFAGNITRHTEPALSPAPAIDYEYGYDGMSRLSSDEGSNHSYDELSNLVSQGAAAYTYEDPASPTGDQMRLAAFKDSGGTSHAYSYDANGNPTAISNQFSSLAWDALSHLRQVVHSQTDDYWYNDAGLRVKKTEDVGGTWKSTYTLFEGDNPLLQEIYTAAGRIQTTYNLIVEGKILAQYKTVYPSTQSVVYFYVDNLGSRRVVVNSGGSAIDRFRYSAWGVATQDVGTDELRSFTGKEYDASGLIYFNARYYDPAVGRFLTEDPSRKGGNWYAYCLNEPVNRVDPDGADSFQATFTRSTGKITSRYVPSARDAGASLPTTQVFEATNQVQNEFSVPPRVSPNAVTTPANGTGGQFYYPRPFPVGEWEMGLSQPGSAEMGPLAIPTNATQFVPVYGTKEPVVDPTTGTFVATGVQKDAGYSLHTGPGATTWGCIKFCGLRRVATADEALMRFASLSDQAIRSGGKSTLTVRE